MRLRIALVAVALVTGSCASDPAASTMQTPRAGQTAGTSGTASNRAAAIQADFHTRIARYLELRKVAAKGGPPLKSSEDPAKIVEAQDALAARIQALRADAKPGDIFPVATRNHFRRLLMPELRGEDGRDAKAVLKDDAPAPGAIPLQVNAKYPTGKPLPTVPAKLLLALPALPMGLEYRILGKDLVLLDTDANIIVDYIRNAIR